MVITKAVMSLIIPYHKLHYDSEKTWTKRRHNTAIEISCWSDFQSDKCTLANNFNRHFTQIASAERSNTKAAQELLDDNLTSRPGIPFTLSPVTVNDISEIMSDLNPNV